MAGWTTTWPVAFGEQLTLDRYMELHKAIWEIQKRKYVWVGPDLVIQQHMRAYRDATGVVHGCNINGQHIPVGFQNFEQPFLSTDWMGIKDMQEALVSSIGSFTPSIPSSALSVRSFKLTEFYEACGIPYPGKSDETLMILDDVLPFHWGYSQYAPEHLHEGFRLAISNDHPTNHGKIATLHYLAEIPQSDSDMQWTYETPPDGYIIMSDGFLPESGSSYSGYSYRYNASTGMWDVNNSYGFTRKYHRKIVNLDSPFDTNGDPAEIGQRARFVGGNYSYNLYYNHYSPYRAYSDPGLHSNYYNKVLVLDDAIDEFEGQEGKIASWNYNPGGQTGYWTFEDPHPSYVKIAGAYWRNAIYSMTCNCKRASSTVKQREYTAEGGEPTAYNWCDGHWVKIDYKVYEYNGTKWVLAADQESGPSAHGYSMNFMMASMP